MSDRQRVWERARGSWASILPALGVPAQFLGKRNGPCPMCGGKDRYRFTNFNGDGSWVCNQCGHGTGIDLVKHCLGVDFAEAARRIEQVIGAAPPDTPERRTEADYRKAMTRIWERGAPITGECAVGRYLASRGLLMPRWPAALRSATGVYHTGAENLYAAMLAKVCDPQGKPANVHRTYIGDVTPRKMMMAGTVPTGSAVRLFPAAPKMGIAEGIENALAASMMIDMPVWSAVSANVLAQWEIPEGTTELHVFGDNDENYHGQWAAYSVAFRAQRKCKVYVHIPEKTGTDWCDVRQSGSV